MGFARSFFSRVHFACHSDWLLKGSDLLHSWAKKVSTGGTGEIAQGLRALAVLGVQFPAPTRCSQPPITPDPGDLMLSSGLQGHVACRWAPGSKPLLLSCSTAKTSESSPRSSVYTQQTTMGRASQLSGQTETRVTLEAWSLSQ